jgi:hypothetical protein
MKLNETEFLDAVEAIKLCKFLEIIQLTLLPIFWCGRAVAPQFLTAFLMGSKTAAGLTGSDRWALFNFLNSPECRVVLL